MDRHPQHGGTPVLQYTVDWGGQPRWASSAKGAICPPLLSSGRWGVQDARPHS